MRDELIEQLKKTLTLPSWMNKGEPVKLASACRLFWLSMLQWVWWPLDQLDPMTCNEKLLDLIAFQWDIDRLTDEPLDLYRKRVNYAFINAQDAGEVAGFIAIFDRLGIGEVTLDERMPGIDWDVIGVNVTDNQITNNTELLTEIIRHYGRTCRRYVFKVTTKDKVTINAGQIGGDYGCYGASLLNKGR